MCPLVAWRSASRATRVTRTSQTLGRAAPPTRGVISVLAASTPQSKPWETNRSGSAGRATAYTRPTVTALRQFEKLWLAYRKELQLGSQTASVILDEVRKGRLPSDAHTLRRRVRDLQLLDPLQPRLRLRQLLAAAPRSVLLHDPQLLVSRAAKLAALLPSYDTTHVLVTVLPYLDRDPHVTALNFLELDDVFGRAFGGARVPPSVFAHLLRPPGASVLPPPPPEDPTAPATWAQNSRRSVAVQGKLGVGGSGRDDGRGAQHEAPADAAGHEGGERLREEQLGRQQPQRWREAAVRPQLQRYVDPGGLLRKLRTLVASFGRETAYLAVQRHPALLDRDPDDLAHRMAQFLAAIDPRVAVPNNTGATAAQKQATAMATGSNTGSGTGQGSRATATAVGLQGAGGATAGLYGATTTAAVAGTKPRSAMGLARTTAQVLEDSPQVLDLDPGEVHRRLAELGDALEWSSEQVAKLAAHAPAVLARDSRRGRENLLRLRLVSLRRPNTWRTELAACLAQATPNAAAAASAFPSAKGSAPNGPANKAPAPPGGSTAATWSPSGERRKVEDPRPEPDDNAAQALWPSFGRRDDEAAAAAKESAFATLLHSEADPDHLSLLARVLTADAEVIGRFEYLISSGQRPSAGLRELLYERRVKFVRLCPQYSRWWADGAARARGETGGAALELLLGEEADGGERGLEGGFDGAVEGAGAEVGAPMISDWDSVDGDMDLEDEETGGLLAEL